MRGCREIKWHTTPVLSPAWWASKTLVAFTFRNTHWALTELYVDGLNGQHPEEPTDDQSAGSFFFTWLDFFFYTRKCISFTLSYIFCYIHFLCQSLFNFVEKMNYCFPHIATLKFLCFIQPKSLSSIDVWKMYKQLLTSSTNVLQ